jgi:ABC-2 type transport system permease protein
MVGVTFALTAMALGFGALYPNYETENVAEIPTSFGGLLFMMAATTYLAAVVALQGWPVYRYLAARAAGVEASPDLLALLAGVGGAAALTAVAVWLPLRAGVRAIRAREA